VTPMKFRGEPQGPGQVGESLGCLESVLLKCRCTAISGRRGTPLGSEIAEFQLMKCCHEYPFPQPIAHHEDLCRTVSKRTARDRENP
jgi:hypothetical protein